MLQTFVSYFILALIFSLSIDFAVFIPTTFLYQALDDQKPI